MIFSPKGYQAPFFNIVSSISPSDDLTKGKSFFMAEVESILRIISALEKDVPVFCPIEETLKKRDNNLYKPT